MKNKRIFSKILKRFVDFSGTTLLTDNSRFQINEHGPGHVLAGSGFAEKRVEAVVATADGLVRRHLTVGGDAMFQTVQLPAGVTDLDTGLADVHGNTFTL